MAAVDWYKMLSDINNNLDANNQILLSEDEFKAAIMQAAEQQQQMMAAQAGEMVSTTSKNLATANKSNKEAQNVGTGK